MNTLLTYLYRDAGNWKKYHEVVLSGELQLEDIIPYLHESEFFIPSIVGLTDLQTLPFGDADHIWHEMSEVAPTTAEPSVAISSDEFITRFINASAQDWHIVEVFKAKELM